MLHCARKSADGATPVARIHGAAHCVDKGDVSRRATKRSCKNALKARQQGHSDLPKVHWLKATEEVGAVALNVHIVYEELRAASTCKRLDDARLPVSRFADEQGRFVEHNTSCEALEEPQRVAGGREASGKRLGQVAERGGDCAARGRKDGNRNVPHAKLKPPALS
jgi:hypothetical protein